MFKNIDEKIKGIAKAIAVLGIVCGVIVFLACLIIGAEGSEIASGYGFGAGGFFGGLITGGLVFISCWISAFPIYALGEIITNQYAQNRLLNEIRKQNTPDK